MKREIIENEEVRLNALRNLRLLDTPPSESFDLNGWSTACVRMSTRERVKSY